MAVTERVPPSLHIDGVMPREIVAPDSDGAVAAALAGAREAGQSVIPCGGATLLHIGNAPTSCDVALWTGRMSGIEEYNPADLTVVARAGTTLAELNGELGKHGQFLPLQAPLPQRSTLGGAVAANASGPWRLQYGTARDMVIGMRMALPSGEIARSGGKVVKNVAGYDLAKVFIGSYGTLGVIVELAFKVFPLPSATQTLVFTAESVEAAFEMAARLRPAGPGLLALALINDAFARTVGLGSVAVIATAGGSPRAVDDLATGLRAAAGVAPLPVDPEGVVRLHRGMCDFAAEATLRVSTLPSATQRLADLSGSGPYLSYPAIGLSYSGEPAEDAAAVRATREMVGAAGGRLAILRVAPQLKRQIEVWGEMGPEAALMRTVKDVFDPGHVMSPGRLLPA